MILGVDIGSFATKTSKMIQFNSRVSSTGNILGNDYTFELNGETYFIEEGEHDTEYRKIKRTNYIKLLFAALVLSKVDQDVELVLGLPISQFNSDKENLIQMIEDHKFLRGYVNGKRHEFFIKKVLVYPEGIGAAGNNYNGIIVDIGGRTTDVCLIRKENGKRKIHKPESLPLGTIELYGNFIGAINSRYGLDLKFEDTERILREGLKINGKTVDINFAKETFYNYMDSIIQKLKVDYSLSTNDIFFTGGGSMLLETMIYKKIPHALVSKDGIFGNAKAYEKFGEESIKWKNQ